MSGNRPTLLGPTAEDLLGRTKRPGAPSQSASPQEKMRELEELGEVMKAEGQLDEEETDKIVLPEEETKYLDDLEDPNYYMMFRGTVMDNPSVRREIEARTPKIDKSRTLEGRWTQIVSIIEGDAADGGLTVCFRTLRAKEKDYLHDRWSRTADGRPNHAVAELLPIYYAALSIEHINRTKFPEPLLPRGWEVPGSDEQKKADASFDAALNRLDGLMDDMRDAIVANHRWFQDRVGREMRRPGAMKSVAGE